MPCKQTEKAGASYINIFLKVPPSSVYPDLSFKPSLDSGLEVLEGRKAEVGAFS